MERRTLLAAGAALLSPLKALGRDTTWDRPESGDYRDVLSERVSKNGQYKIRRFRWWYRQDPPGYFDESTQKYVATGPEPPLDSFEHESAFVNDPGIYYDDNYLGDVKMAEFLTEKMGLRQIQHFPALDRSAANNVERRRRPTVVGVCPGDGKWYGWSHRCIVGFGGGDMIFEEEFGDDDTPFTQHGSQPIKSWEDARLAAGRFARSVN